jgi:ATP-binding cassette subfamily F protein uup
MSVLLSAQHLSLNFGSRAVLSDFSCTVREGERIGILGDNGSGKSTLLRLLAKEIEPDDGVVTYRKGLRLSYVAQTARLVDETQAVASIPTVSELLHAHAPAGATHEQEAQVTRWLRHWTEGAADRRIDSLSGGEQKRLQLLCAFVSAPEVMLLDEPTNHLDLNGILWLEDRLREFRGTVLLVTHDRALLNAVARSVLELAEWYERGFLKTDGDYDAFLRQREEHLAVLEQTQASLKNKARRELAWLRSGNKAQRSKARNRIVAATQLIAHAARKTAPTTLGALEFASGSASSTDLIQAQEIDVSIGDRVLCREVSFKLSPGTRLGLVGPNGCGKSTLLRVITGHMHPRRGKLLSARGCRIQHFDQQRATLALDQTLRQALCPDGDSVVFNGASIHVTGWAKRFGFAPSQLDSLIGSLSGGERARAILAAHMCHPADVLLLDEPTNDLDIRTKEVLEDALIEFNGAAEIVSHDRYFLDTVCTGMLALGGSKPVHYASCAQWLAAQGGAQRNDQLPPSPAPKPAPLVPSKPKQRRALTYAERLELEKIEQHILEAEGKVTSLEAQLSDSALLADAAALSAHCRELDESRSTVEALYARWEHLDRKSKGEQ